MTEQRKQSLKRKLQESRYRLLKRSDSFAYPLLDMTYVATDKVYRISTNGKYVFFDPSWFSRLDEVGCDFILSHLLMHVALGHTDRPKYYKGDRYHLACDIVNNARLEQKLSWYLDKIKGIGTIYTTTFFPAKWGAELTSLEAMKYIPFDPAALSVGERRKYVLDSDEYWDKKNANGSEGTVVLTPLDADPSDLVYRSSGEFNTIYVEREDPWYEPDTFLNNPPEVNDVNRIIMILTSGKQNQRSRYTDNYREWQETNHGDGGWVKRLNSFIQPDIFDYSFSPPDRRYSDSDLFLPSFTEESSRQRILFAVDTSASIDSESLNLAYSEILYAVRRFGISGIVMFFDTEVYGHHYFNNEEELSKIIPQGNGMTDYQCVFDYVKTSLSNELPYGIVIITDGQGAFPDNSVTVNIPVLWLFNKEASAPWGISATVG